MNDEARLLSSIWETIQEFISPGDRQEAAASIIRVMVELGNDLDLLFDAEGDCPYLDRALNEVASEEEHDLLDEIDEE